jgi:hypothetical protein
VLKFYRFSLRLGMGRLGGLVAPQSGIRVDISLRLVVALSRASSKSAHRLGVWFASISLGESLLRGPRRF